jgi:hypothetical protein
MEEFRQALVAFSDEFQNAVATDAGDWVVKGFIDIHENVYSISVDTKVISKIIELLLFPLIIRFAQQNHYTLVLTGHQNHYPDVTFVSLDGRKIALDFKSTYRISPSLISGFTLGAFTGYFRQRASSKNISFPYQEYDAHYILGVIYSRNEDALDERHRYTLAELPTIHSVAKDFQFVIQEKWRVASDKPGSGNTKNIGSIKLISNLLSGNGTFAAYGSKVFDDYWMNYLTLDMAKAIDSYIPYANLAGYLKWRENLGSLE